MLSTPIVDVGGAWLNIPIPIATTGYGQYKTPENSVTSNGRLYLIKFSKSINIRIDKKLH